MFGKKRSPVPAPEASSGKKKPLYKKWWFWLLVVLFIGGAASSGSGDKAPAPAQLETPLASPEPEKTAQPEEPVEPEESAPPEDAPDIEVANDFEALIWKIAKDHGCELTSIETVGPGEDSPDVSIIGAARCPNDEESITKLLNDLAEEIKKTPEPDSILLAVSDKTDKADTCIATAYILADGSTDIVSMSIDFNNARNQWIRSQFSLWDGSHTALKELVIKQLNDEKSFRHSETTYRDISSEAARDEVNDVLASSGYSQRVEVGDLFIQMTFTAKNAFNATIKNTAYGIASFNNDTITLIDIG